MTNIYSSSLFQICSIHIFLRFETCCNIFEWRMLHKVLNDFRSIMKQDNMQITVLVAVKVGKTNGNKDRKFTQQLMHCLYIKKIQI